MTYTDDIDESIANCTELERVIGELIEELTNTETNQRKKLQLDIESKLKALKQDLDFMDSELTEMPDGSVKDEYMQKFQFHQETLHQLEDSFAFAAKPPEEKNNNITANELMNKTTELQEQQKYSLSNSIAMANASLQIGSDTAVEIHRQMDQMNKISDDLDQMDGELDRAKVVMKGMVTRAAGDNCVRVLIILVLLCIIGVIVAEVVAPGSIKNEIEKGFTTEGSGTNSSQII